MNGTPGIDVSHHQDRVDWKKVAAAGQRFAVIRSSYGAEVKDRRFETHWDAARQAGLKISSYHFLLPEQPVAAQMDFWFGILGSRKPDFPLVLDVEKNSARLSAEQLTVVVRECLKRVEQRDGRKAIIYTRKSFWDRQVLAADDWAQHDLWVANYVENPAKATPTIPASWKTWKFWQYSESGQVAGINGNVDMNWFNGSSDDLARYGSGGSTTPPVTGSGPRVIVDELNIRSGPGRQFGVVGQLRKNDAIKIADLSGAEIWLNQSAGRWAAFAFNGGRFMELIAGDSLQARVTATRLNVRLAPNATSALVGSLSQGQVIPFSDIDGPEVWAAITPGRWVAVVIDAKRFIALS